MSKDIQNNGNNNNSVSINSKIYIKENDKNHKKDNLDYYYDLIEKLENESEIKAVLINRNGESKFRYINDSSPIPINSITKTIVAILMGIAIKEGYISSVEEKHSGIKIRELLTMSSGMDWEESYLFETDNWVEKIKSCPILEEKRGIFQYNGGSSHILGKLISDRTNMKLEDFADKYLFEPLGINFKQYYKEVETMEYDLTERKWTSTKVWDKDPQGNNIGSFSLRLKAEDLEKIGILLVQKGKWQGKTIVEKDYINDMFLPSVKAQGFGYYGFQGWIKKIRGKAVYSGIGINNQYMTVIPENGVVIVFLTESKKRETEGRAKSNGIENLYINILMNEVAI